MNIFVVRLDPVQAARDLCDSHILKMGIEATQILSTVFWKMGHQAPMKPTHHNHPCTIWAGETRSNFEWLLLHGLTIFDEFYFRRDKIHKSEAKLLKIAESNIRPTDGPLTPFAQAIKYPELRGPDIVEAYRKFYVVDKARFAAWKWGRSSPDWWEPMKLKMQTATALC
jgi:hypothetical protein